MPFKQWVRGSNPRRVTKSSRTSYRSRRLFLQKVIAHSLLRSSFPNRNRCAGVRFGFGSGTESLHIESVHAFHVGASCISLAPTFFKSQSALIPLLLLSTREPQRSRWRLCRLTDAACPLRVLRWIRGWFGYRAEIRAAKAFAPPKRRCLKMIFEIMRGSASFFAQLWKTFRKKPKK